MIFNNCKDVNTKHTESCSAVLQFPNVSQFHTYSVPYKAEIVKWILMNVPATLV